jgi:hypothetical protein
MSSPSHAASRRWFCTSIVRPVESTCRSRGSPTAGSTWTRRRRWRPGLPPVYYACRGPFWRARRRLTPVVGTTGEIEALSLWAGPSVALARQPQPAPAEILADFVSGL